MRGLVVLLLLGGACGSPQPSPAPTAPVGNTAEADRAPPAPDPAPEDQQLVGVGYDCAHYGMMILYSASSGTTSSAFPGAHAIATTHYNNADKARTAGDYRGGAFAYLDCARAYRAVPDTDPDRTVAEENAALCYYNAIYSFADAGVFESEGRAALEREAKADPRLAKSIQKELASPPYDCHP